MSNSTGPDQPNETTDEVGVAGQESSEPSESDHEPATEIMAPAEHQTEDQSAEPGERRFTAPSGFDAGSTQIIKRTPEPATEVFSATDSAETEEFATQKTVAPR